MDCFGFTVWLDFLPLLLRILSPSLLSSSQGHLLANILKARINFFPLILTSKTFWETPMAVFLKARSPWSTWVRIIVMFVN